MLCGHFQNAFLKRVGRPLCNSPLTDWDDAALAVTAFAAKLEAMQPEAFAVLYKEYSMENLDVQADGTVHFFGSLTLDPNIVDFKGLTSGGSTLFSAIHVGGSSAALDVQVQDRMAWFIEYPYVREAPEVFFDLMAADVDGPLAEHFRGYIRYEVKPALDRIKDILQAHFAAIEAPPSEWLIETFPGHGKTDSPNNIVDSAIAYARAWDRVLADWDKGRLDVLFPPAHTMPFQALMKYIQWSRDRGEAKQQELIGMSSGARQKGMLKHVETLSRMLKHVEDSKEDSKRELEYAAE